MTAFWFAVILFLQGQRPDLIPPGAVTGRLLTPKGTPAAGVRIAVVPAGDDKAVAPALLGISQTDADGRYRLENIPPGRYHIFAGLIDLPSYYPNATTLDRAGIVVVDSGTTLSDVDFSLARPVGLTIAGRLAIPPTIPYNENWITTLSPQSRTTGNTTTLQSKVARDGSFEFAGVSPGEYRIASNLVGAASTSVRVEDIDLFDVLLPVVDCNSGVVVKGRLVGSSNEPIRSIALTGRVGCSARASVERDGSFTFDRVPEGTYQLQLTPVPLGWSVTNLTVDKTNVEEMEVQLPSLITVKGQAYVEDGSALPRPSRSVPMTIRAARNSGGEAVTSVAVDGSFELALPRGDYRISVAGIPAGYYSKAVTAGLIDLSTSTLVVRNESPKDIQVTLAAARRSQPGVRLSGHLTFAPTGALLNAESILLVSAGSRNTAVRESPVAADGSFEFNDVAAGTYNLETFPDNPVALFGIVVDKTDVTGIEFSLPVLVKIKGGIEWPDPQGAASASAQSKVSVQFTRKEGDRMIAWGTLAQADSFHFYLPEGDYRFSVSGIPSDFNLSSVMAGNDNILESGLRVRSNFEPPNLRVMLRGK